MGNIYIYRFLIDNTQNNNKIFDYGLNYYVLLHEIEKNNYRENIPGHLKWSFTYIYYIVCHTYYLHTYIYIYIYIYIYY